MSSFNTMTSIATPFIKSCIFEPAFTTPTLDQISGQPQSDQQASHQVLPNFQHPFNDTRQYWGNTYYNAASKVTQNRHSPPYSVFDARNDIWRKEYSQIVGYAPRDYKDSLGQVCAVQPYIVEDNQKKRTIVCPVSGVHEIMPQCKTAFNTLFQCEQFRDTNPQAYEQCRAYQRTIHYDIVTPNGQFIDMAYEMDGYGPHIFHMAQFKTRQACGLGCSNVTIKS
jgi:hypothetical protein